MGGGSKIAVCDINMGAVCVRAIMNCACVRATAGCVCMQSSLVTARMAALKVMLLHIGEKGKAKATSIGPSYLLPASLGPPPQIERMRILSSK